MWAKRLLLVSRWTQKDGFPSGDDKQRQTARICLDETSLKRRPWLTLPTAKGSALAGLLAVCRLFTGEGPILAGLPPFFLLYRRFTRPIPVPTPDCFNSNSGFFCSGTEKQAFFILFSNLFMCQVVFFLFFKQKTNNQTLLSIEHLQLHQGPLGVHTLRLRRTGPKNLQIQLQPHNLSQHIHTDFSLSLVVCSAVVGGLQLLLEFFGKGSKYVRINLPLGKPDVEQG